jgi:streptogramin lyase
MMGVRRALRDVVSGTRFAVVALCGLVVGVIIAGIIHSPVLPDAGNAKPTQSASAATNADSVLAVKVDEDTYDLTYDAERGLVWFAVMQISGPDWLYAVAADGESSRWSLPDSTHNGYLSHIIVDDEGAIWITQEYVLTRFDPTSETMRSVELPLESPFELVDALDPNNPAPGTWISAVAPVPGGVVLARNNVAAILGYDRKLQPTRQVAIPQEYAGARDIIPDPVGLVVLGGQTQLGRVAVISENGKVLRSGTISSGIPESRLVPAGNNILVTGAPPSFISANDLGPTPAGACTASAHATVATAGAGGIVACYDSTTGSLLRGVGEAAVAITQLPVEQSEVVRPPPAGPVTVRTAPTITDMTVDVQGRVWFFVQNDHELRWTGG